MADPTRQARIALPRHFFLLALALCVSGAGANAQPQPPGSAGSGARGGAPLRDEPGDWWGDVHRWTGSDATRPTRSPPSAVRPSAPPVEGARRVTTSATGRANIRRDPSTNAPVLRVMRPGSALTVFGEAPGGWLQVGEADQPTGWIHRSALQAE